jgi:hypothetical protein
MIFFLTFISNLLLVFNCIKYFCPCLDILSLYFLVIYLLLFKKQTQAFRFFLSQNETEKGTQA